MTAWIVKHGQKKVIPGTQFIAKLHEDKYDPNFPLLLVVCGMQLQISVVFGDVLHIQRNEDELKAASSGFPLTFVQNRECTQQSRIGGMRKTEHMYINQVRTLWRSTLRHRRQLPSSSSTKRRSRQTAVSSPSTRARRPKTPRPRSSNSPRSTGKPSPRSLSTTFRLCCPKARSLEVLSPERTISISAVGSHVLCTSRAGRLAKTASMHLRRRQSSRSLRRLSRIGLHGTRGPAGRRCTPRVCTDFSESVLVWVLY